MVSKGKIKFQIGKNGLTSGVIDSLSLTFRTHKTVRISVLKSAFRDKKKVKEMAEELTEKLNGNYNIKVIGFTIILRKAGVKGKKIA